MAADRRQADWEAIEREYRAGQLSAREIARQHGVSDTAIRKKAKAAEWDRDLSEKVRSQARAKLVREDGSQSGSHLSHESEARTVEGAANRQVEVVRQHRHAIGRGRDLTLRLLDELDAATSHVGELEEAIEAETAADKTGQRRAAMLKAVGLPSRAGVIKDLSAAAKNWVALERQAFNLGDDGGAGDDPATKADLRTALAGLTQGHRDNLRDIAAALVGGPAGTSH